MRTIRPTIFLTALAVLLLSLTIVACSGGAGAAIDDGTDRGVAGEDGYDYGGGQPAPSAAPAAPDDETPPDGEVGAPIDDARIVRTGTIELEVKDVPTALALARDGIRAMGGYIGASNTYNQDDHPVASITYRVPVDRWEDALDLLRGLNGQTTKVVTEQTEAVEVTGAVLDLEARIRNLQASEVALQDIAAKAVRVSDVLEVQNQLTQVRGEIESLTAQLKDLEDRADYATLSASFQVPIVAVEAATQDWDPKAVIDEASASLIEVLQALASAGIWLVIVWLPILLALGAIALIVTWIVRHVGIRSRRGTGGGGSTPTGEAAAS